MNLPHSSCTKKLQKGQAKNEHEVWLESGALQLPVAAREQRVEFSSQHNLFLFAAATNLSFIITTRGKGKKSWCSAVAFLSIFVPFLSPPAYRTDNGVAFPRAWARVTPRRRAQGILVGGGES